MSDRVTVAIADGIAQVRLNRPEKLNALDAAMFSGIADAIAMLAAADDVRAVVLAGEGRGFCAGLDMAAMAGGGQPVDLVTRNHGHANLAQQVAWGWRTLPMPVIAAAHGMCFGGGLQIFSGADVRFATADARFAIMETKWGLVPDMAGFALWRGSVRDDVMRELAFTAREFSGEAARDYGFVTQLAEDPVAAATALAQAIAARSGDAVRGVKGLANACADASDAELLQAETAAQMLLLGSAGQIEAVRAGQAARG